MHEKKIMIRNYYFLLSWIYFRYSQYMFWRLRKIHVTPAEELIFIEFRPHWLNVQKKVYENMHLETCAICLLDVFQERVQTQHNAAHPCICVSCYKKLDRCPFCRISFRAIYTSRRLWPLLRHI